MSYKKCSFPKLGKKTKQLRGKRVDPKKSKQIEQDKKRRYNEWREWWS